MTHIMALPLPFNYQIPKSQLVNVTLAGLLTSVETPGKKCSSSNTFNRFLGWSKKQIVGKPVHFLKIFKMT